MKQFLHDNSAMLCDAVLFYSALLSSRLVRQMAEARNQNATVYVGNLDERVRDELLFELMLQAGPVVNVHIPKDRVIGHHQGYGFTEFLTERDAEYAVQIMNQVKLFGKPIRVNRASSGTAGGGNDSRKQVSDIGAEIFVGNLAPTVDERMLYETFSTFGNLLKPPTIARGDAGKSKGFGFVNFDDFENADRAIEAMHNQYLMNQPISVRYAAKQRGKTKDLHGDAAERLLAQQAKKNNVRLVPKSAFDLAGAAAAAAGEHALPLGFSAIDTQLDGFAPPPPMAPPR